MARPFFTACLIAGSVALGAPPAAAQFVNPFEACSGRRRVRPAACPAAGSRSPPAPQDGLSRAAAISTRSQPGHPQEGGGAGIQSQPLPPPPGGSTATIDPRGPLGTLPPGQRPQRGAPADTSPQPGDEVIAEPPSQKITNKGAVFSGLDKITGRIINFDVAIGETVQFGALQVTPRVCYTRPPTETPNTDAFIEVDEVTLQGEVKRIFTGWMFASSPGLHGVEHPIYDVWLTDCKEPEVAVAAQPDPPAPTADPPRHRPAAAPPAQRAPPAPARAHSAAAVVELLAKLTDQSTLRCASASAPVTGRLMPSAPKSPSPASAASSSL